MSRRPVTDRPRHIALLRSLGSSPSPGPVQASIATFHLLAETSDALLTEGSDNLDYEHV
jgi:hypothetical protein